MWLPVFSQGGTLNPKPETLNPSSIPSQRSDAACKMVQYSFSTGPILSGTLHLPADNDEAAACPGCGCEQPACCHVRVQANRFPFLRLCTGRVVPKP